MHLLIVFNAKARFGRSAKALPALREIFEKAGVATTWVETCDAVRAGDTLANMNLGSYSAVVAAGGDGTIFEVLNGLYRNPLQLPMGILPLGTGNATAREFGLAPDDLETAVARLLKARKRHVDVGCVESREGQFYFLNIIGAGLVVDAGEVARRIKFFGRASYTLAALWQCLNLKQQKFVMTIDGKQLNDDLIFIEVSNSRYTGTSFLMAPDAVMDDGYFDLTMLKPLSRLRLLKLFKTIYSGTHTGFEEVETLRAQEIKLSLPQGAGLMPDGEFVGSIPATIRCLKRDLELIC